MDVYTLSSRITFPSSIVYRLSSDTDFELPREVRYNEARWRFLALGLGR